MTARRLAGEDTCQNEIFDNSNEMNTESWYRSMGRAGRERSAARFACTSASLQATRGSVTIGSSARPAR